MPTPTRIDELVEWEDFAKRHLRKSNGKIPTRRVGKRLVHSKEIPGRVVDGCPRVYELQWILGETAGQQHQATTAALELLGM